MLKNLFLLTSVFLISIISNAAEKTIFYDSTGVALLEVAEELIKNPDGRIIYNIQGNIVFQGTGEKSKDILMMLKSDNIFGKKGGQILGQNKNQTVYYTYGGGYYIRPSDNSSETQLLAYWQKTKKGVFQLHHGGNDSLLAFYPFEQASDILLTALFHYFQTENNMAMDLIANYVPPEKETKDISSTSGTIRRMWGGGNDEFEWDGYVLKRKWGNNPMHEWTFDGLILKRVWSSDGREEFIWENDILRRRWYNSKDEFVWNGRTIRRRYGPELEEYIIQGSTAKSMWSQSDLNQWEIDGDVPVPIIAMVIYGLVYR